MRFSLTGGPCSCGSTGRRVCVAAEVERASVAVAGTSVAVEARVWSIDAEPADALPQNDTTQVLAWRRPAPTGARASYRIAPSQAADAAGFPRLRVGQVLEMGSALPVRSSGRDVDWAAFGDTVHALLAADRRDDPADARIERARRLLAACPSGASLPAEALLAASDRLAALVAARWPGAVWHRELPIRVSVGSQHGLQRVNGSIDLLLEADDGFFVIDHKSYANPTPAAVRAHAEQYLAQLAAYGAAIGALGGKAVREYWLHLPVAGVCVRCEA